MNVEGDILINGSPMEKKHRRLIGYVRQSDVHFNNLSCREVLTFSAHIRLPASFSNEKRAEKVNKIIGQLGLQKCADTIVGGNLIRGISGGEKKRLSVGVELVTSPTLLFLDEPTSGLDSHMAYNLFEHLTVLKNESNCTLVTTIHQPSSKLFADFDLLLLLSEGRIFYFGPVSGAVDYFASHCRLRCPVYSNPAEYFLDIASIRLHPNMELGYPKEDENGAPLPPITWDKMVEIYEQVRQNQNLESIEAARIRCLAEQKTLQAAIGETISRKGSRFSKSFSKFSINNSANGSTTTTADSTANGSGNEVAVNIESADGIEMTSSSSTTQELDETKAALADLDAHGQTYARSVFSQFQILARRSFVSFLRDKRYFRARIIQVIVMALLIGVIFLRLPYNQAAISARAGAVFFLMIQIGISKC